MIVIMLFGISLIATISAEDTLKGLIAGLFGLMIGYIGADVVYEAPRGTFGFLELYDKVPLIPALVGLFAISEAFVIMERETILSERAQLNRTLIRLETHIYWYTRNLSSLERCHLDQHAGLGDRRDTRRWSSHRFIRSLSAIAPVFKDTRTLWQRSCAWSHRSPKPQINGVTSGTLIPLLIIGVPGGATAAIMAVVLEYHGVHFGPDLFETQPMIAYGSFTAMAVTYVLLGLLILPLTRYFSRVMIVPTIYMAPILIAFTLVGSFVPRAYVFDMGVAIVFGIIGYIARRTGYHVAAILIGVILGPLLENYFLRALRISQGDLSVLFSSTIGNILWILLLLSLLLPALKRRFDQTRSTADD